MNDSKLPTILMGPVLSSTTSTCSYSDRLVTMVCWAGRIAKVGVGEEAYLAVLFVVSLLQEILVQLRGECYVC